MGTGLDTARLEAQLENERQQLSVARYDVERLKLSLIHGLGIPFDVQVVLTDTLKLEIPEPPPIADAVATAMAQRIEIKAQEQRIRTASLALTYTVSERVPSLTTQGDYGLIGNRYTNTLDTYSIGLFLSVPLFGRSARGTDQRIPQPSQTGNDSHAGRAKSGHVGSARGASHVVVGQGPTGDLAVGPFRLQAMSWRWLGNAIPS